MTGVWRKGNLWSQWQLLSIIMMWLKIPSACAYWLHVEHSALRSSLFLLDRNDSLIPGRTDFSHLIKLMQFRLRNWNEFESFLFLGWGKTTFDNWIISVFKTGISNYGLSSQNAVMVVIQGVIVRIFSFKNQIIQSLPFNHRFASKVENLADFERDQQTSLWRLYC